MNETLNDWQNRPHDPATRNRVVDLIAVHGAPVALELSRGMVVQGSIADVEAIFAGEPTLGPWSFTERDWVADAFAKLDDPEVPGAVKVKVWLEPGANGLPILEAGDESFSFEGEWVVLDRFTAEVEVLDDRNAVVTLKVAQ